MTKGNRKALTICIGTAAAMLLLSFASVPLYDLFCRITGYGGTPRQEARAPLAHSHHASGQHSHAERAITVRFDANTSNALAWDFHPQVRSVELRPGEEYQTFYVAKNLSNDATHGMATFNVSPDSVGQYFVKYECFCFTEQTLQGKEAVDMGVSFYLDPELANDPDLDGLTSITLSYTFFPMDSKEVKQNSASHVMPAASALGETATDGAGQAATHSGTTDHSMH